MNDSDDGDDYESDWETGPFCRHFSSPGLCDEVCATCRHSCGSHDDEDGDTSCLILDCTCSEWKEQSE